VGRCPTCEGQVSVPALGPDVVCPRCGATLGLTGELADRLTELRRLRSEIVAQRREIAREARRRRRAYGTAGTLIGLGFGAVIIGAALMPVYLWMRGLIAEKTVGWLIALCAFGTFFLLGVPLFLWQDALLHGRRTVEAPIVLDGPLTVDAVERELAEAAREARQVRLSRYAEPRLTYLYGMQRSAVRYLELAIGVPIVAMFGVVAVLATIGVARGDEPDDRGAGALWAIFAVGVGVVILLRWRRRTRQRRVRSAAAELQSQLGVGQPHTSSADTVDWLNRHWAAPTPADDYFVGPYHVSTATNQNGYDVMVDVEPYGFSDENGTFPPRLVIYLAAVREAHAPADRTGDATHLRSSIEQAGFSVRVEVEAGLVARALPSTVLRLRSDPSRLSLLGPVITNLVALAVAHGFVPPEP
jgi:hypothetical protein